MPQISAIVSVLRNSIVRTVSGLTAAATWLPLVTTGFPRIRDAINIRTHTALSS